MIPQVFPMNRGRPVRPDGMRGAGERQRERLLMQRIAELPLASDEKRSAPEPELVAVAAALLESDVTFGRAFGGACCGASAQRLLLAVYIAEGQDCELSLASVSSSAAFEPAAVSLRWAIKLLADGALQLVSGVDGERSLRVAPAARMDLQRWLTRTRTALCSLTRDFAA